jgi:glycosyltransferase involved in cell wall biosynthesis
VRIAFVNSTRKWGGVKTWCLDMASALSAAGHDCFLFGRPGPFMDKAAALGLSAHPTSFGPDLNPLAILRFLRFFRSQKIDWLVANVAKEMRTAGVAAALLGIPICQHIGAPGDLKDGPRFRLTRRLLRPHLVTPSAFVRDALLERLPGLTPQEVTAIAPGVRVPKKGPSHVGSPPLIMTTSRLDPDKGHAELLQALARVRQNGFAFRAELVGTGREAERLQNMAHELDLADWVAFPGFTTDVAAALRRADIYVLPSFEEPLSIALEEAMAHGLAPVARRAGGVPEIWPPALGNFLFDPNDGPAAMASILSSMLAATEDELLAWKRTAWTHAGQAFPLDRQARLLEEFLAQRGR